MHMIQQICLRNWLTYFVIFDLQKFEKKIDRVMALWRSFSVFQDVLPSATKWQNVKFFNLYFEIFSHILKKLLATLH